MRLVCQSTLALRQEWLRRRIAWIRRPHIAHPSAEMAQTSAEDVAKFLGVAPDDPMVLEHLQAAGQIDDAAARTARRLGDSGATETDGWTRVLSRRAMRARATRAPAPVPPTPDSRDDEAATPATARGRLLQSAGAEAVRRRAKTPATRRPQPDAGKLTRSGPRKQRKAEDDDDDDMPPPPPRPQAPPAPPQPSSPPRAMVEEGNDSTEFSWDSSSVSSSDSSKSLDDWARYRKCVSAESLSKMPTPELLRVADGLKLSAEASLRGAYVNTCASLDLRQPTEALAVKVIRSLAGLVSIDDALAVFDAKEEDVAERARSREATLRADATHVKEAKARAAEKARQAELASAKAAPKPVKDVVTALGFSFEVRAACSSGCNSERRWNPEAACICGASDTWSSSVKLIELKGKRQVEVFFNDDSKMKLKSRDAYKRRLRPAGGGNGEDAVALLKKAAVAAGLKDAAAFFDE